jgi:hypothetical protein
MERVEMFVKVTYIVAEMDKSGVGPMPRKQAVAESARANRVERLGFRIDEETKDLIERAAHLTRRKVSDFA